MRPNLGPIELRLLNSTSGLAYPFRNWPLSDADAEFINNSQADITVLIAEVKRLQLAFEQMELDNTMQAKEGNCTRACCSVKRISHHEIMYPQSDEDRMNALKSAGILDKDGKLSDNYKHKGKQ